MFALTSIPLRRIDAATGPQIVELGGRNLNICGNFVMEAQILVNIGSSGLAGSNRADNRSGPRNTIAASKYAFHLRQLRTGVCQQGTAALNFNANLFESGALNRLIQTFF